LLDAVERLNETIERLQGERDRLAELLHRVEPELVPNHDEANALSSKLGLGPIGAVDLIREIREALAGVSR
jgi:hypothetical protein